jgi:sugar phosphate isomerase/epimerase
MIFSDFGMDTASLAGSLEAKLDAIRAAGFAQVTISAADVVAHPAGKQAGVEAVRTSGLRVSGYEALRDFEGLEGHLHAYKVDVAKAMLSMCCEVGSRLLLVEASRSSHASADRDTIARDLTKLALLAIPLGIRVAFKPSAASRTVKSYADAMDVLDRAPCPNLGLALDSFEAFAAGTTPDELDELDPQRIFLVQLSDFMWNEIRSEEEQTATAAHFRVFPGEGVHSEPLVDLVRRLDRLGYYGDFSFDVYNDDYLQLPTEVVAQRARNSAVWLVETGLRRALPVPDLARLRAGA